ncbi:tryptophan-rich sensory protein [Telmatocola sphagniphila]|uniref:Tryptophan-rich sensory protein n=1 Tax=Telmatocola sphagniphila TaxID=1123043 RepID=A0A8E6B3B7_9BACT|nr:TspO/MBR family protein [Telmatocola sphagniphila]QVL30557.1 tryptophan-rich sensory protein [Telmatocola sphagniphila]
MDSYTITPSHRNSPRTTSQELWALLGWIGLSCTASISAVFISTGDWFRELQKPSWNPPNWVFGPVWTTLYILMGVAAWYVWRQGGWRAQRGPLALFLVQLILNAIWTPLFFGIHDLGLALLDIGLLWLALLATAIAFLRVQTLAGGLLLPYIAWVSFAMALNFRIWQMNS